MSMSWLYGRESEDGWTQLQPRVFDIDVVRDTFRILEQASAEAEARRSASENAADPLGPRLVINDPRGLAGNGRTVEIDQLDTLGVHERALLSVQAGDGVYVSFRRWQAPIINGGNSGHFGPALQAITDMLRVEGRRRIQWRPLLRFLPAVFALALTGTAAWVYVDSAPSLPMTVFGFTLLIAAWTAVAVLQPWIGKQYMNWSSGHRFREGSRAAFRERVVNLRANIVVGLIGAAVGAIVGGVLGYVLRIWLGE